MRKTQAGILPALLALVVLLGGLHWWWGQARQGHYRDLLTAALVMAIVKMEYYQPVSLNRLAQAYLKSGNTAGMLKILGDPYTRFLPKKDYAELKKETEGIFGGIGVFLIPQETNLIISSVVKGSPGEVAGLVAGDRITAVENIPVGQLGTEAAMEKIKGRPGTNVKLQIMRMVGPQKQELNLQITRRKIIIPTVELTFKSDPGLGQYAYLVIRQFAETTAGDLERKLKQITVNRACRAIVLDLRGNPGGQLDAALRIAGAFLPPEVPVIHIKHRGRRLESVTNQFKCRQSLPMAVLVDGGSASASEIVAGALKDQKRAILVGTHTFGKDLIQQVIDLPGGGAVSVTIASYLTSGKVNIHHKGVRPDYVIKRSEASQQLLQRGETAKYMKTLQLQEQTAVRILREQMKHTVKSLKTAS